LRKLGWLHPSSVRPLFFGTFRLKFHQVDSSCDLSEYGKIQLNSHEVRLLANLFLAFELRSYLIPQVVLRGFRFGAGRPTLARDAPGFRPL
jgi:hypothetical protein